MGYRGTADGLLDADTNMTYAVKYLAGAYRAAGCNEQRAINYYQRGFYKRPTSKCALPRSRDADRQRRARQRPAAKRSMTDRDAGAGLGRRAEAASGAGADDRPAEVRPSVQPPPRRRRLRASAGIRSRCCGRRLLAPAIAAAAPRAARRCGSAGRPRRLPRPQTVAKRHPSRIGLRRRRKTLRRCARPCHGTAADAEAASGRARRRRWRSSKQQRSRPASQNDAVNASPDVQVAKLDSAAVPLPQPKPEIEAAPERESQARPPLQPQRHTYARVSRKKPEESGLVTFWKKLTTPNQPRAGARPRLRGAGSYRSAAS